MLTHIRNFQPLMLGIAPVAMISTLAISFPAQAQNLKVQADPSLIAQVDWEIIRHRDRKPEPEPIIVPLPREAPNRKSEPKPVPVPFPIAIPTIPNIQPLTIAPILPPELLPNPLIKTLLLPTKSSLKSSLNLSTISSSKTLLAQKISFPFPIKIPRGSIPKVIKHFAIQEVAQQLARTLGAESPVRIDPKDTYPTVAELPGSTFVPASDSQQKIVAALKLNPQTPSLPPGDYSIAVHVFCMKHSAGPPDRSVTFLLAPFKGKQAQTIAALNSRFARQGIDRSTIQNLSWAIQAGLKYDELTATQQEIVDRLIPEYKSRLSKSFWEEIEQTWSTVARPLGAPSLESTLSRLGAVGEVLNTYREARSAIIRYGDDYTTLERIFLQTTQSIRGNSQIPRGTWSKIGDRVYARLLPTSLSTPGRFDIRVLPER
jgi:hypothetical protein